MEEKHNTTILKTAAPALAVFSAVCIHLGALASSASVPAAGSYVVAADRSAGSSDWSKVVDALKRKHKAKVVQYDGRADLSRLLAELKKTRPRYVCFVARPESVGRDFVKAAHEAMRQIDDDPYGDAIWGVVTGYDAQDALRLVNAPLERTIRSYATSMGGPQTLDCWDSGFASDERTADNFWLKKPGGANEKIPTDGNIAKSLSDAFNAMPVDYFMTSGHASERDWQIVYNQDRGKLVHTKDAGLQFVEPGGKARHDLKSASLKVYLGAGNCLIGNIDRRDCMAVAWMHTAGVEQFCGYTVPSWYGFMGWGVAGLFGQGRYSLAEARYLENERLVWARMRSHPASEDEGLDYDRDVFAYYGDPAQRIMFPEDATPYKIAVRGSRVGVRFTRDCTFAAMDDVKGARPVVALLDIPPPGDALFDKNGNAVPDAVVTERFIFIPLPGNHSSGEALEFRISHKERNRELGYAGDDADAVCDAVGNIIDSTSGGGLEGAMDAVEGLPGVEIGTDVQVITM